MIIIHIMEKCNKEIRIFLKIYHIMVFSAQKSSKMAEIKVLSPTFTVKFTKGYFFSR
mgnify:CR=1 FL=1